MNLQSWYLFLIFLASFHPSKSKDLGLGAKNSVLTILNSQRDVTNSIMFIKIMNMVKEQHLRVGHRLIFMASQKFSSLALFYRLLSSLSAPPNSRSIRGYLSSSLLGALGAGAYSISACLFSSSAFFSSSRLLLYSLS